MGKRHGNAVKLLSGRWLSFLFLQVEALPLAPRAAKRATWLASVSVVLSEGSGGRLLSGLAIAEKRLIAAATRPGERRQTRGSGRD